MNKKLPESQYKRIIFRTIPSRQMREFLCLPENMLNCFGLAEIIIGSPEITITEKYEFLCSLANESGEKEIAESADDFKAAIDNLVCAPGEIFTVDDPWYDEDIKDVAYGGFSNQPCLNYDKVLEYIDWNERFEERDEECTSWYKIKKTKNRLLNFFGKRFFNSFNMNYYKIPSEIKRITIIKIGEIYFVIME